MEPDDVLWHAHILFIVILNVPSHVVPIRLGRRNDVPWCPPQFVGTNGFTYLAIYFHMKMRLYVWYGEYDFSWFIYYVYMF